MHAIRPPTRGAKRSRAARRNDYSPRWHGVIDRSIGISRGMAVKEFTMFVSRDVRNTIAPFISRINETGLSLSNLLRERLQRLFYRTARISLLISRSIGRSNLSDLYRSTREKKERQFRGRRRRRRRRRLETSRECDTRNHNGNYLSPVRFRIGREKIHSPVLGTTFTVLSVVIIRTA